MKKIRYILWTLGGVAVIMAGCAFMDVVWSNLISQEDLARSNNITGVETCREMSHLSFRTWLFFNPKGRQTYYLRSECFQQMAVRERDESLCNEVVERKSLYFNGSGVSPGACREAVLKQKQPDSAARVRPEAIHRIRTVTITRIPYSDTVDVRVSTTGSLWGTYRLSMSLHDARGNFLGALTSREAHLGYPSRDALGMVINRRDVQQAAGPRYRAGERYVLAVSLELLRDDAGQLSRSGVKTPDRVSTAREILAFE